MKQLKLGMFLICFALEFDSSEGKRCCVSRAYAVCWVTPNFWENALIAEKKSIIVLKLLCASTKTCARTFAQLTGNIACALYGFVVTVLYFTH